MCFHYIAENNFNEKYIVLNTVVYRSDKQMLLTDLDVQNKSKIYIAFFTNLQCYTLAVLGKIDDCDCEINPVMFTIRLLSWDYDADIMQPKKPACLGWIIFFLMQ